MGSSLVNSNESDLGFACERQQICAVEYPMPHHDPFGRKFEKDDDTHIHHPLRNA